MHPRLPTGHWLDSVEASIDKLLEFAKSTLPPDVSRSERLREAIARLEESRRLIAQEAQVYHQEHLGIPEDYRKLPSLEDLPSGQSAVGLIAIGLAVAAFLLFLGLYNAQHGDAFEHLGKAWGISLTGKLFAFLGLAVGTGIGVAFLHEGVHGVVLWGLTGKFPRFIRGSGAIGPTFDGALSWGRYLLVLVAPFGVLTGLGVGLVLALPPAFAIFPLLGLIFNTLVSIGDFYALWQLLRAGPRALGTAWGIYAPKPKV